MLAQDKTFGFSVPGSNTTIEISTEGLREILGQVEAELYRSEVYRRALTNLQQMPSKGAESVQFLMKAIGREAIRLTLRNFVHTAVTPEPSRTTDDRDGDDFPVAAFSRALGSRVTVLPTAPEPTPQAIAASEPSAPIPQKMPFVQTLLQHPVAIAAKVNSQKTSKRLSPAEAAAQVAQDRHTALQQIGTQIRTKREQRSMSLSQLHNKTLVPMHQLQGLESGFGSHLPEDVYLRGFIKRVSAVLELDTTQLLEMLPPDATESIVPSWYHPTTKSSGMRGVAVQPIHLYVGYAALMAGGLVWLSQQSAPDTPPGTIQLDAPNVTTSPQYPINSQEAGSVPSVSPPERL